MKRFFSFFISTVFLICILCDIPVYADESQEPQEDIPVSDIKNITIVSTNNINSYIDENNDKKNIGLSKILGFYNSINGDILLDSGNLFFGQSTYSADKGKIIAKLISYMNYSAVLCGVNDWIYGSENIKQLQKYSNTDFIASNVLYFENQEDFFDLRYKIVEKDDIKIGIFGVIDNYYNYSNGYELRKDVYFYDEKEYANNITKHLRETEKCDIIICMANLENYMDFAEDVSGIDLVLLSTRNGESLNQSINNTIYLSCAENLSEVGVTEISFMRNNQDETNLLLSASSKLYSYDDLINTPYDEDFQYSYNSIKTEQSEYLNTVISNTDIILNGNVNDIHYNQTSIGALITNAYLLETGADIAFELSSNIKNYTINKGNITLNDCISILDTDIYIVTKQLTGQEILDTLELMIDFALKNNNFYNNNANNTKYPLSYMQFSGMKVYYNKDNLFGRRVTLVRIGNSDINLDKVYTVAMSNTLSNSTDFLIISGKYVNRKYCTSGEAIINYVRENGVQSNIGANRYIQEEKPIDIPQTTPTPEAESKSYSYIAYILLAALLASAVGSVYIKNKSIIRNKKKRR